MATHMPLGIQPVFRGKPPGLILASMCRNVPVTKA